MSSINTGNERNILVTGATGYIGGRLVPVLENLGYNVRCLARNSESLNKKVGPKTQVYSGDMLDPETLGPALKDIHAVFYLVHSMGSTKDFAQLDRTAAFNFARSAKSNNIKKIIYLGGLGEKGEKLSPHLNSRHEVGDILRSSGIQVIELRASVIIGSGSLSFELIRSLVERLPIMITPRWVSTPAQPIAINDVLTYLVESIKITSEGHITAEIGGSEITSYGGLMKEYARQRGLKRLMISVPVLTPRLSSLWLGLITPVYARIGRKLIDSMRYPSVVIRTAELKNFSVAPVGIYTAISDAMVHEDNNLAQTRWSDAQSSSGYIKQWGGVRFGRRLLDVRSVTVPVDEKRAFEPIMCIGGRRGWYYGNWLWKIRGFIDLTVGGVGVRRGRSNDNLINVGDTIDWWRVEAYEPNRRVRLIAEMKVPGRAWLEFEVVKTEDECMITQTAIFDPVGIAGILYWYSLYPLHQLVFSGMLNNIKKNIISEALDTEPK